MLIILNSVFQTEPEGDVTRGISPPVTSKQTNKHPFPQHSPLCTPLSGGDGTPTPPTHFVRSCIWPIFFALTLVWSPATHPSLFPLGWKTLVEWGGKKERSGRTRPVEDELKVGGGKYQGEWVRPLTPPRATPQGVWCSGLRSVCVCVFVFLFMCKWKVGVGVSLALFSPSCDVLSTALMSGFGFFFLTSVFPYITCALLKNNCFSLEHKPCQIHFCGKQTLHFVTHRTFFYRLSVLIGFYYIFFHCLYMHAC